MGLLDRIDGVVAGAGEYTEHLHPESAGIGLATVHSFVEELGGRTEIRSALGKGCSVWLYIPIFVGT